MLEKHIERKVCAYATGQGWLEYKFVSPTRRGVPDRILFFNGHTLFIEFKQAGKRPTRLQEHQMAKLREHGMRCEVIDSVVGGAELIDNLTQEWSA